MVISQPAVVCLQVTIAHSTLRATAAGERLRRLLPRGGRPHVTVPPFNLSPSLPDIPNLRTHGTSLRADV